jgi:hypothetical protein
MNKREKLRIVREQFENYIVIVYNSTPLELSEGGRWGFNIWKDTSNNYFEVQPSTLSVAGINFRNSQKIKDAEDDMERVLNNIHESLMRK